MVVVDRDEMRANSVALRILANAGHSIAVTADVTRPADVHQIVSKTLGTFGRTIEVNLKGPFLMMKHVVPHMIEAGGGSIINTSSISAFTVVSTAGYSASKAGLVAMTRVAAAELGRYNIRVNACARRHVDAAGAVATAKHACTWP